MTKKKVPAKKKAAKKKAPAKKAPDKKAKKKASKKTSSKKKRASKKAKTFIALVVDRSGSMETVRAETIEHYNEQAEKIAKDAKGTNTTVSLITFASNNDVQVHYMNQPVSKLQPLTLKTYVPGGMTAMYDAVGTAIDKMLEFDGIDDKDSGALVVILSDGQENDSTKYKREHIAEKIQKLQNTKRWTFSYLGANQDLSKIQKSLHIPVGNTQSFVANTAGVKRATGQSVNSMGTYLRARKVGQTSVDTYYSGDK